MITITQTAENEDCSLIEFFTRAGVDAWLEPNSVQRWMSAALKGIGLSGEIRRDRFALAAIFTRCSFANWPIHHHKR
jgi:hypothetical protein